MASLSGIASYCVSNYEYQKSRPLKATTLAVTYDDSNYIEINELTAINKEELNSIYPYHMKLVNNGEIEVLFQLILEEIEAFSKDEITLNIMANNKTIDVKINNVKNNVIYEGSILPGEKNAQDFYIKCLSTNAIKDNYKSEIKVNAIEFGGPGF